jgi:mevalonate kinase
MKWSIPAKTFLLGEYTALQGGPAIVLTTSPCFEVALTAQAGDKYHPDSPGGRWWGKTNHNHELQWHDPYKGCGGLGASSAQFIGAYLADCYLQSKSPAIEDLLSGYYECGWDGTGVRPSGYDLLAQTQSGCVFLHRQANEYKVFKWPFVELAFVLIHTQKKIATHEHLRSAQLPSSFAELTKIVLQAQQAFLHVDATQLISAVSAYHHQLMRLNLVAEHSQEAIALLKNHKHVLSVKGCGALGADVLLILVPAAKLYSVRIDLQQEGWKVLASSEDLYIKNALIENNTTKRLEISS